MQANAGYIGMFTKKLSYSSSDGNSDVVVNGIGMKDDFNVESGIITCGDVSSQLIMKIFHQQMMKRLKS